MADTAQNPAPDAPASASVPSATWGGAAQYSSFGQRYSGRDLITGSIYRSLPGSSVFDATLSKGLSDVRTDSHGGDFFSASLGQQYLVKDYGILSARETYVRYRQGGPDFDNYDLLGNTARVDVQFIRPLSASLSVFSGVSIVSQKQNIGIEPSSDRQTTTFLQIGAIYALDGFASSTHLMQGIAGRETYEARTSIGPFSPNFIALAGEAKLSKRFAPQWSVDAALNAQLGSHGTPSSMAFYLGGLDRGRAYTTGNLAGASGVSAVVAINYEVYSWLIGYAGVDGGVLATSYHSTQSEYSAFIGLKTKPVPITKIHSILSADIGVSEPVHCSLAHKSSPALGAILSIGF